VTYDHTMGAIAMLALFEGDRRRLFMSLSQDERRIISKFLGYWQRGAKTMTVASFEASKHVWIRAIAEVLRRRDEHEDERN